MLTPFYRGDCFTELHELGYVDKSSFRFRNEMGSKESDSRNHTFSPCHVYARLRARVHMKAENYTALIVLKTLYIEMVLWGSTIIYIASVGQGGRDSLLWLVEHTSEPGSLHSRSDPGCWAGSEQAASPADPAFPLGHSSVWLQENVENIVIITEMLSQREYLWDLFSPLKGTLIKFPSCKPSGKVCHTYPVNNSRTGSC